MAIFFDYTIAFLLFIIFASGLLISKRLQKRDFALVAILFFIFTIAYLFYYTPGFFIAKGQGPVLDDNWYRALNWMKENTPECTVVATYWDPGHFITGVARRAVVFDGASQSILYTRDTPEFYRSKNLEKGINVERLDNGINHIVLADSGNITTARIQDISTTLLTANETLAVNILREYLQPDCTEMYYIASSDLIGKSTWWTYFATWDPVKKTGTPYVYSTAPLGSARPDIRQNAIIYTYPISQQESFVVYITNSSIIAFLQQQGTAEPLKIKNFVYFDPNGNGRLYTQDDAVIDGTLWIEPSGGVVLFIPPQLENALFTRMFLYNGVGLQSFEFVNNWGGEVKLYKVKFD